MAGLSQKMSLVDLVHQVLPKAVDFSGFVFSVKISNANNSLKSFEHSQKKSLNILEAYRSNVI